MGKSLISWLIGSNVHLLSLQPEQGEKAAAVLDTESADPAGPEPKVSRL